MKFFQYKWVQVMFFGYNICVQYCINYVVQKTKNINRANLMMQSELVCSVSYLQYFSELTMEYFSSFYGL